MSKCYIEQFEILNQQTIANDSLAYWFLYQSNPLPNNVKVTINTLQLFAA